MKRKARERGWLIFASGLIVSLNANFVVLSQIEKDGDDEADVAKMSFNTSMISISSHNCKIVIGQHLEAILQKKFKKTKRCHVLFEWHLRLLDWTTELQGPKLK